MTLARILRPIFLIGKKQVQSCKQNNQISGIYTGIFYFYTLQCTEKTSCYFLTFIVGQFIRGHRQKLDSQHIYGHVAAKQNIECPQYEGNINKLQSKQRRIEKDNGKMVTLFTCFTFRLNTKKYIHNSNRSYYEITRPTL